MALSRSGGRVISFGSHRGFMAYMLHTLLHKDLYVNANVRQNVMLEIYECDGSRPCSGCARTPGGLNRCYQSDHVSYRHYPVRICACAPVGKSSDLSSKR